MPLSIFHPVIQKWFLGRFGEPTEPQRKGWPFIASGRDTLIAAPTGSGKTLAAFLAGIDRLFREGRPFGLPDETRLLYVSPLKALSNDVQRNLQSPLREIEALALAEGVFSNPIRVEVRTGDTPASARQAMIKRPPHILVTTPESLYLLLTAEKGRRMLSTVNTVILDEIHAVARDKRGSHLALSLERLEALCPSRPLRIGLSATQRPMEAIARFMVGSRRLDPQGGPDCAMVEIGHGRTMDLGIEIPEMDLSAVCSNEQWETIYGRLADLVVSHRSTLVFVNTRRLAERITHRLADRLGSDAVSSHHGSLSKGIRLEAEQKLKEGTLRAVVATASLELGIDIGFVDLVIQIGSPRSIATFLQRIGRSGHALGRVPKGRLFALTRDELMECAALLRAVRAGRLDRTEIPQAPLDILAQQMVAETAAREMSEDELYEMCRRAWPYRDLPRETFDRLIEILSEGFSWSAGRVGAYLHRDRVGGKIRARRGSRLAALTSGGAIPDLADYRVVARPDGVFVGTVDEDFAIESMSGDIFLLGNTSWRILHVRGGEVSVADAHGAPPTIPFWRGEAPARTIELSAEVSRLRGDLAERADRPEAAAEWLRAEAPLEEGAARQLVEYVRAQKAAAGMVPTQEALLAERFFDESGGMQLVIHSPFGGRINRAWGLALRKSFCRTFDFELQASADDDGIVVSLGPRQSFGLDGILGMIPADRAADTLEQALLAAPMFMTRWRWNANRALAVLRQRGGRRIPPPIQRMRADDLLTQVFPQQTACRENMPQGDIPIPDHPLVRQTVADCLTEAMDRDGWLEVLAAVRDGRIGWTVLDAREPSPFAYELLNASPYAFLDDAPLEERRARAVATRRSISVESVRDIGRLDPEAIDQVRSEVRPTVRGEDELHEALMIVGLLPEAEGADWREFFDGLLRPGRAVECRGDDGRVFWAAVELWPMVRAVRPDLIPRPEPAVPAGVRMEWSASEAGLNLVRGRLEISGPVTVEGISEDLGLEPALVESALGVLEADGILLRGIFNPGAAATEFCARNHLARIHRLTIDRARRKIQAAGREAFLRYLIRWQGVREGGGAGGPEALLRVIECLQGFEIPAAAWETAVLPARLPGYDPRWLDALCLGGEVVWARVSSPARRTGMAAEKIRGANRLLPVSLMIREDLHWLRAPSGPSVEAVSSVLGTGARAVWEALVRRGATFFSELSERTGLLPAEVEGALWELVASGLVTADGFSALRSLASSDRRRREALARRARRRGRAVSSTRRAAGRWTRVDDGDPAAPMSKEEIHAAWAGQLLTRYGIVFRDLLAREDGAPPWYVLRPVYRRMEARGEIFGGRFVSEVSGEQFALPEAVESLRRIQDEPLSSRPVYMSAADPLNLAGILSPGPRIPAVASNAVVYMDGKVAGWRKGSEIWVAETLEASTVRGVERTLAAGRFTPSSPERGVLGLGA